MIKKEILVYAAGLFDGEGCVRISKAPLPKIKKHGRKSPQYRLYIDLNNTDPRVIVFFKKYFGGKICESKSFNCSENRKKPLYHWFIISNDAIDFLNKIKPFSIIKKEQIDVAIKFQIHINRGRHRYNPRNPLSQETLIYREKLMKELSNLKNKKFNFNENHLDISFNSSK